MAKKVNKGQDRDQQILSRLAQIEHKVDSIDETNAFALRAEADKHQNTVSKIFRKGKRRAQVYLAADGTRGVDEIAKHLKMKGPNVSRDLRHLKEEGLLEISDALDKRTLWAKKPIDRTLRITKYLCNEYDLKTDGSPNRGSAKRTKHRK